MKRTYIYILFLGLFLHQSIVAQELNKDVKVVREYNPIISDANKINKLPQSEVDSSVFKPRFSYEILSKAMTSGLAIEPITAARLTPEKKTVLDKSYAQGGLGNYATIFGEINYNVLRSSEYALGLNLGHTTSGGTIKLEDDSKSDAPYHDTWTSLYFRRFFKDYTLSIDADFLHNVYNYYGYSQIVPENTYYSSVLNADFTGSDFIVDERQRMSSFGLDIGFQNKVLDSEDFSFDTHFKWNTFGNITGVRENNYSLNGTIRNYFDNIFLDVVAGLDYFGTTVPVKNTNLYQFADRNMTILTLSPAVGFVFEGINLKLGLDTYSQLGGVGEGFNIAPHLEADFVIADGIVTAFGGLKGDYKINNYEKIQRENPFVAADIVVKNSFHGIHLFGGIKGNFSSQTSFVTRVDYSVFNNEHFYRNRAFGFVEDGFTGPSSDMRQTNIFDIVYDDGKLLSVSGEMKYEPSNKFNILLKGKYNGWKLDNYTKAWHKPEVELGLISNFSPLNDLWINVGFYSQGKRYAYDVKANQDIELKSVLDLNLGAHYYLSSKWTIFASLNNALVSKYYMWNGYPSQGLNVRAGVGYSF